MKYPSLIKQASFWLIVLITLSVIKPGKIPNINRYIGMGVWLLTAVAFLSILIREKRYRQFLQTHAIEIILTAALFALHLISLGLNLKAFPNFKLLVFYGFAPLSVFSLFVMAWTLFRVGGVNHPRWPALGLLLLIHGVAIGQYLHYEWLRPLTRHTIAADIMRPGYITSVFPHHTIYGTIAAVSIIYALNQLLKASPALSEKFFLTAISLLALIGGVLTQSRNFLWTLLIGLLCLGFFMLRRRPAVWVAAVIVPLVAFHAIAWHNPGVRYRYKKALPYLGKLDKPTEIHPSDFVPRFSSHSLTGRPRLWLKAIELWKQSPWIGIGPGAYNLVSGFGRVHGAHCYYLQVLMETGVGGALILLLLLGRLLQQAWRAGFLPVLAAIMASLVFDNFLDKSMAWVILMAWFLQPETPFQIALADSKECTPMPEPG